MENEERKQKRRDYAHQYYLKNKKRLQELSKARREKRKQGMQITSISIGNLPKQKLQEKVEKIAQIINE